MTRPQSKAFLFAGVAIAFAAAGVVVRSFAWYHLNAHGAAKKDLYDPAVVAEFRNLRIAEFLSGASIFALFLCFNIAFRTHWEKAWQLYLLVILGLSCFFFAGYSLLR